MEGVQHNTYDVEFYGPDPNCETWYLAALKAMAVMATAMGDAEFGGKCAGLFQRGGVWTDANLFNGEFYIQKIRKIPINEIATDLLPKHDEDSDATDSLIHVRYQLGEGCHIDQECDNEMRSCLAIDPFQRMSRYRNGSLDKDLWPV